MCLECVLVSIKATVVWYLIKKDERMTLTLHDFWEGVASNVRQKYSAGKKDVGINLELVFGRDKTGIAPSAPVAELPAAKISLTQTAKLKKEADERDRLRAGIVEQTKVLQMSRICKGNCHNKGKYCWINESGVHHRLTSDHIRCWSEAISRGDGSASLTRPPRTLAEVLVAARSQVKRVNPFSAPSSAVTSPPTFIQPPQITGGSTSIADVLALQMIQKATAEEERKAEERRIRQKRKDQQKQSRNKLKMLEKTETPSMLDWHRHTLPVRPSSPVQGDDLRDYISWHVSRVSSTRARPFWHAFDELDARYYDLQTIQSWKERDESHWKSLNIPAGIGIQLARDVSKYARSRGSGSGGKLPSEPTAEDRSPTSAQQARVQA